MSQTISSDNDTVQPRAESWKAWLQRRGNELLSVHFIITILVLSFWFFALSGPLSALSDLYNRLPETGVTENVSAIISKISESAMIISGLFTTVLGLVLGHFFGQRGQETAEIALALTEQDHDETIDELEEDTDVATAEIEDLTNNLELSNAAVSQLIEVLEEYAPEGIEVDDDSPVGRLLAIDEEP